MRKLLPNGQHAEDCECATCEVSPAFAANGRQQMLEFEQKARERRKAQRAPRIRQTEELLDKWAQENKRAAPPPEGGWRAFLNQQQRGK